MKAYDRKLDAKASEGENGMNQLVPSLAGACSSPLLLRRRRRARADALPRILRRQHPQPHTRRAYAQATREFLAWCESAGVASITDVQPLHVAAYIEQLGRERSAPTAKQRLAAIRHLFDWLVTGQVMPVNPASSVRGPSHSVKARQDAGA